MSKHCPTHTAATQSRQQVATLTSKSKSLRTSRTCQGSVRANMPRMQGHKSQKEHQCKFLMANGWLRKGSDPAGHAPQPGHDGLNTAPMKLYIKGYLRGCRAPAGMVGTVLSTNSKYASQDSMVTWLHLRTHHLWRTIKEVGLLSQDSSSRRANCPGGAAPTMPNPWSQMSTLHRSRSLVMSAVLN